MKQYRVYKEGDATGRLVYEPHGRRSRHFGRNSWQFRYILYVYKGDMNQGYQFTMSLPSVYISYVKAIVKAVAETLMPNRRVPNHYWWLRGKTWRHPQGGEYPILKE